MRSFLETRHAHAHAHAIVTGLIHDPFVAGNLLESLLRARPLPSALIPARALFARAPARSTFMWNTLLRAHLSAGLPAHAALLFDRMILQDGAAAPNHYTYPLVLKALAQLRAFQKGHSLRSMMFKRGLDSDPFVQATLVHFYGACNRIAEAQHVFDEIPAPTVACSTALLSGYAKIGDLVTARELFDEMPERNLVSWSAMISGYVQHGKSLEALALFREMLGLKVQPSSSVLVSVLVAVAELGALQEGKWVHCYLERSKVDWTRNLKTSLVHMYSKCGDLASALQAFGKMRHRGVDLWNAMITGLGLHGKGEEALELFNEMLSEGLKPDDLTFIGVLCACSHAGLVKEGLALFDAMSDEYNVAPKVEHYSCTVDLLGRAGVTRKALELIESMPMEANGRVWGSLFGACRIHGDIELGERVGRHLIKLDPHRAGRYVLLSNLYASIGKWRDALGVRDMMKERGVKLEPGCSMIEVDGVVHEFLLGDERHPMTRAIYQMLEDIAKLLSHKGYVPRTNHVLFDISEEEKEGALFWHSEKLAMAFGLLSTCPGTVIRIVKNLRICGDCHSMAKVVSEAYDREIVIRDRSRFHHFKQGSCSCKDYW